MMNRRALAWDDEPDDYLTGLAARFKGHHVTLEVETQRDEFWQRFNNEHWDFIILDVMDASDSENQLRPEGIKLAERIRKVNTRIPIVFITGQVGAIAEEAPISGPVSYRAKVLTHGDMINDILDFIKVNLPDNTKVFLIYGHGRKSGNIKADVIKQLKALNLTVDFISPENSMSLLASALIERMSPCGAFIALCSPDDKIDDKLYQPRGNVLLEIGIVMGLLHGLERLIILQRWGNDPREMAQLPTDLSGKLTIQFFDENHYQDALDTMILNLNEMGLRINSSA